MSATRREFVRAAAGTAAGLAPAIGASGRPAPSDRVRLGFIGTGGRGRYLMNVFKRFPDVDIPVICDVIEPRMDEAMGVAAAAPNPQKPQRVVEYRRILDRKDVDAVVIATNQHWHGLPAIHSSLAGKPFFVEKPLSHTVVEGRVMVEAAKKHGVVAMIGTQQRCGKHYQEAVEIVRSGRLGKIALVECWNYGNAGSRVGRAPDSDPPPGYHWDLWLGPAPKVPFNPCRLRSSSWWDYGGGMVTEWGVHHVDIILWAMGVESPMSAVCTGGKFVVDDMADAPDTVTACWEFPNFMMQYFYRGTNSFHVVPSMPHRHGIAFYGNQATLVLDRFGYEIWSDSKPDEKIQAVPGEAPYFPDFVKRGEQDGLWHRWFLDGVKENKKPPFDLELGHKATVCCQLANIAYRTGRKIRWDGSKEQIVGDPEAARLLQRPRRQGFELPEV